MHCRATKCSIHNMLSRRAYCVPCIHNMLPFKSGAFCVGHVAYMHNMLPNQGAQSCSGRVFDQGSGGFRFEPHLKHYVVVFSMTIYLLLRSGFSLDEVGNEFFWRRPSVHPSVRPSIHPSRKNPKYLLLRFDAFLV